MADYHLLQELHLSKGTIACYRSLDEHGSTNVSTLAKRLGKQPAALYRALHQLERKGLVAALKTDEGPTYFYAVPVNEALERLADFQRQTLKPLIISQFMRAQGRKLTQEARLQRWVQPEA